MSQVQSSTHTTAQVLEQESASMLFAEADQDFSRISKETVVTALKVALPASMVLHTDEQLRPYECDGFMLMAHVPLAVVMPETDEQVVSVIKVFCHIGVPIVVCDAGKGTS